MNAISSGLDKAMCKFSANVAFCEVHFHTRRLREWRRFQTALYITDIQITSTHNCCFTSVGPFVRCCVEGKFAENVHIV